MLIYLHGFRSSPQSAKAQLLARRCARAGLENQFACPQLPVSPRAAIAQVRDDYRLTPDDTLVGSSLGGYYATWLAELTGCRAVLVNPAVFPWRDLLAYVGPMRGYHDNKPMQWLPEYIDELIAIQTSALTFSERYLLLAAKGDELLDWREMVAKYHPAQTVLHPAGDHGFTDFADYLDPVWQFAGLPAATGGRADELGSSPV